MFYFIIKLLLLKYFHGKFLLLILNLVLLSMSLVTQLLSMLQIDVIELLRFLIQ